jgi:hypothetical protein
MIGQSFRAGRAGKAEGDLASETVCWFAGAKASRKVVQVTPDKFLRFRTAPAEQASDEADPGRFNQLRSVFEFDLCDVRVFRVGNVNIDFCIVGKTKDGEWAGLKTKAVEP